MKDFECIWQKPSPRLSQLYFATCCFSIFAFLNIFLIYIYIEMHTYKKIPFSIFCVSLGWNKKFSDKKLLLRKKHNFSTYSVLLDMSFTIFWCSCPKFRKCWEVSSSRLKSVNLLQESNLIITETWHFSSPGSSLVLKCIFFLNHN